MDKVKYLSLSFFVLAAFCFASAILWRPMSLASFFLSSFFLAGSFYLIETRFDKCGLKTLIKIAILSSLSISFIQIIFSASGLGE